MSDSDNIRNTQSAFPAEESKPVESCPVAHTAPVEEPQAVAAPPPPEPEPVAKPEEKKEKTWIKIELVDMEDKPIPGERYRIKVPNESTPREGTLDSQGQAAYFDLDPGTCEVTFPDLDKEAWDGVSRS